MADIDDKLVNAVIHYESGGDKFAMSDKGAAGLMQLMPDTAKELGVTDRFDEKQNRAAGTKYLKQLHAKYGDVEKALIAYNWGPGNVDTHGVEKAPESAKMYAKNILAKAGETTKGGAMRSVDDFLDNDEPTTAGKAQPKTAVDVFLDDAHDDKHSSEEYESWEKGVPAGSQKKEAEFALKKYKKEHGGKAPEKTKEASLWEKTKGAGEAALTVGSGILATLPAAVAVGSGAVRDAYNMAAGNAPEKATAEDRYVEQLQDKTYAPRTEKGKEYVGNVSKVAEQIPMGPLGPEAAVIGGLAGRATRQAAGAAAEEAKLAGMAVRESKDQVKSAFGAKPVNPSPVQETAAAGQAMGLSAPPSQARPNLLNNLAQAWAGKSITDQKLSASNVEPVNRVAKRALGFAEDEPVSSEKIKALIAQEGTSYEAVKQSGVPIKSTPKYQAAINELGASYRRAAKDYPEIADRPDIEKLIKGMDKPQTSAEGAIETVKILRNDAKANLKAADQPERLAIGLAQRKAADALDDLIEQNLSMAGKKELVTQYKKSREVIAKAHDVDAALNDATGDINAMHLVKLLDKGKPLTGELRDLAEFAKTFPKAVQPAAAEGAGGAHSFAGTVLGRSAVGGAIASKPYQRTLAAAPRKAVPAPVAKAPLELEAPGNYMGGPAFKPKDAPEPRPTMELQNKDAAATTEPDAAKMTKRHDLETHEFPLRQEVLQNIEVREATDAFRSQADLLQTKAKKAISPAVREKALKDLRELQTEFAAGMKQLGIETAADATGILRPLYESKESTKLKKPQLPIKKALDYKKGGTKTRKQYTMADMELEPKDEP